MPLAQMHQVLEAVGFLDLNLIPVWFSLGAEGLQGLFLLCSGYVGSTTETMQLVSFAVQKMSCSHSWTNAPCAFCLRPAFSCWQKVGRSTLGVPCSCWAKCLFVSSSAAINSEVKKKTFNFGSSCRGWGVSSLLEIKGKKEKFGVQFASK